MNQQTLATAIAEAERFLRAAKDCRANGEKHTGLHHTWVTYPPKQSGAAKRASMDLTRALADLRRSG